MGKYISKLLQIASPALSATSPQAGANLLQSAGALGQELLGILRQRNGFYAFEGALHVLPADTAIAPQNLVEWNQPELWRSGYDGPLDGFLFWAEDIFGFPFAMRDDGVYRFDPETEQFEFLAASFEGWAERVLGDYDVETGYALAKRWQIENGELAVGARLVPKKLFVFGGTYEVENLYALDATKAMRLRADIARQIRGMPDGTVVTLSVED